MSQDSIFKIKKENIDEIYELMYSYNRNTFPRELIEGIIKDDISYFIKQNNKVIAFCINRIEKDYKPKNNIQNQVLVFLIMVDKNELRKGYGTKILKYSIEQIKLHFNNNVSIILHVSPNNEAAVSLYKKVGFILTENLINFYHKYIPEERREKDKNYDAYEMEYKE